MDPCGENHSRISRFRDDRPPSSAVPARPRVIQSIGAPSLKGLLNMNIVFGPVLSRADGYAFDTWTAGKGVTRSYPYDRVEHAYYARKAEIRASGKGPAPAAIVCQTLYEFIVKLTGNGYPIDNAFLAAKNRWLQRQMHTPVGLGNRPFVVGRRPVAGEGPPLRQPDLMLDDTGPFRLSRNHFMIEQCQEGYHVQDLRSALGTMVNGERIGDQFRTDYALLRAGENEVIAGSADSPFVFSVCIPGPLASPRFSH
jgi:hypothetical protein